MERTAMKTMTTMLLFCLLLCTGCTATYAQESLPADSVMELPAGCSVLPNLLYKTAGEWKGYLDLYLPADTSAPVPLVVLFHGGGWNKGSKESVQRNALSYLKIGCAVANVEYRLLAVAPAPAAVEDARCALLWLVEHSKEYRLNANSIITTGTSAGAHLAMMIGLLPAENQFDRECKTGVPFTVVAIVNKYGIADVSEYLPRTHWFDNVPKKEELVTAVSPITYIRKGIPPIISIHGDEDPTVSYGQAVRLHQKLDSIGIKNQLYTVKGGQHGKFEKEENKKIGELIKDFLAGVGITVKK